MRQIRFITGKAVWELTSNDVKRWYEISVRSHRASTVRSNALKLRALTAFALSWKLGLDEAEAGLRARQIWSPVRFRDLSERERQEIRLRDKIITPEELNALLRVAEHPRTKALIAVAYETGARPHELLSLRLRDVVFHREYALLRLTGKTGERAVPIIRSLPYLQAWLAVHPGKEDPDAPLFCIVWRGRVKSITVEAFTRALKRLSKRANLARRIHPYMFRHTRLTELAERGLTEYQLKQFAGWTPGSKMAERYIRMGRHAGLRAVLETEGVVKPEETKPSPPRLRTIRCPRCGYENMADATYCARCGLCLSEHKAIETATLVAQLNGLLDKLLERPEVREILLRALAEMIMSGEVRAPDEISGAPGGT